MLILHLTKSCVTTCLCAVVNNLNTQESDHIQWSTLLHYGYGQSTVCIRCY